MCNPSDFTWSVGSSNWPKNSVSQYDQKPRCQQRKVWSRESPSLVQAWWESLHREWQPLKNRGKLDEVRLGLFPIVRKLLEVVYEIDVGYRTTAKRFTTLVNWYSVMIRLRKYLVMGVVGIFFSGRFFSLPFFLTFPSFHNTISIYYSALVKTWRLYGIVSM